MLLLAWGLLQAGVAAIIYPTAASATSVSRILPDGLHMLEVVWQASYICGGFLIFLGVLRPWPVAEVLGEWLALWAMFINVLALVITRGPFGAGGGAALGAFLLAGGICLIRIRLLHCRARLDRRQHKDPIDGPERRRP